MKKQTVAKTKAAAKSKAATAKKKTAAKPAVKAVKPSVRAAQKAAAQKNAARSAAKALLEKRAKAMPAVKGIPVKPAVKAVLPPTGAKIGASTQIKQQGATAAHARTRPAAAKRTPHVTHTTATSAAAAAQHRQVMRLARAATFNYMRAPGISEAFDVGDTVEVFCDHERNGERVRGWIKGIVVQVDNKLVAVQFRSNVFLTDGWMVPDRILWYSLTSDQIRPATFAKRGTQRPIPDY